MKNRILTFLVIGMVIILITKSFVYPFFMGNDSCEAYNTCEEDPEGTTAERTNSSNMNMGQLIIYGADYFLKSQSAMLMFLDKVEMSELNGADYTEFQTVLNEAITNLENASATYTELIAIAKETPYDQTVIERLKTFDYQGYQEKNGLVPVFFAKVESFLIKGDVTGAYISMKSDMDSILDQLYIVKGSVDAKAFPDISLLWRINQQYSEAMFFGMYESEVFINL